MTFGERETISNSDQLTLKIENPNGCITAPAPALHCFSIRISPDRSSALPSRKPVGRLFSDFFSRSSSLSRCPRHATATLLYFYPGFFILLTTVAVAMPCLPVWHQTTPSPRRPFTMPIPGLGRFACIKSSSGAISKEPRVHTRARVCLLDQVRTRTAVQGQRDENV